VPMGGLPSLSPRPRDPGPVPAHGRARRSPPA
jgi:hypothetical protein